MYLVCTTGTGTETVRGCHLEIATSTKVDAAHPETMHRARVAAVTRLVTTATITTIADLSEEIADLKVKRPLRKLTLTQPVLNVPQSGGQHNNNQHNFFRCNTSFFVNARNFFSFSTVLNAS